MISLHAQVIKKDGKKEYVVLPYEEFLKIKEELEDYDDLRLLREAKMAEKDSPTFGLDEIKDEIEKKAARTRRGPKSRT